jgi:serine phosphatase RsbU (regulator of sigma subunit)
MAMTRGMITALLQARTPVSAVCEHVSRILSRRPDLLLVSVAIASVDLDRETLTFATAGHPPPLLRRGDGSIQRLDTANGPIIGLGYAMHREAAVPFPVGSRLVMYTDGLVERPDRPFDDGITRLEACLRQTAADPERCVDEIVAELIDDAANARDDAAVFVVDRVG